MSPGDLVATVSAPETQPRNALSERVPAAMRNVVGALAQIDAPLSAVSDPSGLTRNLYADRRRVALGASDCASARQPSRRELPTTISNPRKKRVTHP